MHFLSHLLNLGGSQFAQNLGQIGSQPPRFRNIQRFPYIFNFIQRLLHEGKIQYDGFADAINNVDDPVVQQFITGNSILV